MKMRTEPACLRWLSLFAVVTFSSLLAQDFLVSGTVYSQESAETFLEEGVASYNDLYVDQGITKLNRAIQLGLGNKDDLIRAYKYLAFAYITIGENDKARECFGKILKLDPFYELNKELSPKILQLKFDSWKIESLYLWYSQRLKSERTTTFCFSCERSETKVSQLEKEPAALLHETLYGLNLSVQF